jgi:hypothetical protein
MAERELLGATLSYEERIAVAQLSQQPGWQILVRMIAEACRNATEAVIRLDPQTERYQDKVVALQTTARAMNKFSAAVLDSVKVHQRTAVREAQRKENPVVEGEVPNRFKGFRMPTTQSPSEGAK